MRIDSMDATIRSTPSIVQEKNPVPVMPGTAGKAQGPEQEVQSKVSEAFIKKAVGKANETMQVQGRCLQFKIHEKTNEIIVKIVNTETKEVIREIPSEKMLDMFASMLELAGLIVDERR